MNLKLQGLRPVLVAMLVFVSVFLFGQNKISFTAKGVVKDEKGESVPGATVQIKNTRYATATDIDGAYTLVGILDEGNYDFITSFVGYAAKSQSITVNGANSNITQNFDLASDILNLDEVLVTGASPTSTRKQLGNSIGVVKADDIKDAGTSNTLGALSGKLMGAQITQNSGDPAGGFSIRLRGAGSINSGSDPLYIIDGVIVDNSSQNVINLSADTQDAKIQVGQNRLVDLNPNDVDHIETLNGAAAAAIYGSRAGNGVVQIFTKRGKSGATQINFSTGVMVSELRKEIPMTTVGQRFGVVGDPVNYNSTQDRLTTIRSLGLSAAGLTAAGKSFTTVAGASGSFILVNDKYPVQRYDYWKNIFGTATGTDNSLSFSGGNDKTQYYTSLSYYDNQGILKGTNFQKYTLRANVDQTLASWAKLSINLAANLSKSKDMPNGNNFFNPISGVFIIDNIWDLTRRDANGNLLPVERVRINPLTATETYNLTQATNRAIGNVKLSLYPINGLSLDFIGGGDMYSLQGNEYHPRIPYWDPAGGNISTGFFPDGYVSTATSNVMLFNHDFLANYNTNIATDISSTTTVGYQIQSSHTEFSSQEAQTLASFAPTDASIPNASVLVTPFNQYKTDKLVSGYFGQQTFGYKNLLFVTAGVRVDKSSVFAPQNQNQLYPKVSFSWVLSDYWKGNSLADVLSTAKIRAAWGKAGNQNGIGPYDRFNNVNVGANVGYSYVTPSSTFANPSVRPEVKTELEVGADLAFFKNRVGLSINLYDQKVRDLLLTKTLPPSVGGTSIVTNVSSDSTYMQNQGIELMLNVAAIKQKDMQWNVGVIFNSNKNRVYGLDGGYLGLRTNGTQSALTGLPYGVFYGTYYARKADGSFLTNAQGLKQPARGVQSTVFQGTEQYGADGQPKGTELRKVIGDPTPQWTGSLITDFTYKKFTVHALLDAVVGAQIYNWNRVTSNNVGWGPLAEQEILGTVPRGSVLATAGGAVGGRIQEDHIEDATFVKLREVGITYNIGKVANIFQNVGVSLIGRNLLSFDKYTGFDPEVSSSGQSDRIRGDDFGAVPIPRQYMVRLNVKF